MEKVYRIQVSPEEYAELTGYLERSGFTWSEFVNRAAKGFAELPESAHPYWIVYPRINGRNKPQATDTRRGFWSRLVRRIGTILCRTDTRKGSR